MSLGGGGGGGLNMHGKPPKGKKYEGGKYAEILRMEGEIARLGLQAGTLSLSHRLLRSLKRGNFAHERTTHTSLSVFPPAYLIPPPVLPFVHALPAGETGKCCPWHEEMPCTQGTHGDCPSLGREVRAPSLPPIAPFPMVSGCKQWAMLRGIGGTAHHFPVTHWHVSGEAQWTVVCCCCC